MYVRVLLLVVGFVLIGNSQARSEVRIAEEMRFQLFDRSYEVAPGYTQTIPIALNGGSIVDLEISSGNAVYPDLSVYICSELDVQNFRGRRPNSCYGASKLVAPFHLERELVGSDSYYVLIDNTYSTFVTKKVRVIARARISVSEKEREQFANQMQASFDQLFAQFEMEPFDFSLGPCGRSNAFSGAGGDITFCSELFFPLLIQQNKGAIMGILSHELGHSVLRMLGLPNWDNEEAADEFAVVLMYWAGVQEQAVGLAEYFDRNDPALEIQMKLHADVRHPLGVQRARNIRRILNNPGPVISRWNNMLYPHLSRAKLQKILENPQRYEDADLAQRTLN